jgi:hypothetical protein
MVTRRLLLGTLVLAPFAARSAFAQSATGQALDDFARYIDAATSILGELALGLRNADARDIRGPDARHALEELQTGLRNQAVANDAVIDELSQYYEYVRRSPRSEGLSGAWSLALQQVSQTAEVVRRVTAIVDESTVLRRVLSDNQQIALRDTLAMREAILARLATLPPPTSADELERLSHFIDRYEGLIATLHRIRTALNGAMRE